MYLKLGLNNFANVVARFSLVALKNPVKLIFSSREAVQGVEKLHHLSTQYRLLKNNHLPLYTGGLLKDIVILVERYR